MGLRVEHIVATGAIALEAIISKVRCLDYRAEQLTRNSHIAVMRFRRVFHDATEPLRRKTILELPVRVSRQIIACSSASGRRPLLYGVRRKVILPTRKDLLHGSRRLLHLNQRLFTIGTLPQSGVKGDDNKNKMCRNDRWSDELNKRDEAAGQKTTSIKRHRRLFLFIYLFLPDKHRPPPPHHHQQQHTCLHLIYTIYYLYTDSLFGYVSIAFLIATDFTPSWRRLHR